YIFFVVFFNATLTTIIYTLSLHDALPICYSDIARGSAQLLGFHFMVNFRQPYLSHRLQEFWRRWHISLSTWLRDYLYIPLGGSAGGEWKISRNLLVTMVLAGLWHGANWTFVVFGAIHGTVLAAERYFFPAKTKQKDAALPQHSAGVFSLWAQRILTFNVFCLSLAFFHSVRGTMSMPSSISSSKSPALVYLRVLLGICAILVLLLEICANSLRKQDSETYARVSQQYAEAVKVRSSRSGEPASVLMV